MGGYLKNEAIMCKLFCIRVIFFICPHMPSSLSPFYPSAFYSKIPLPITLVKIATRPPPSVPQPALCCMSPSSTHARRYVCPAFLPPPWKQAQGSLSASLLPLPPPQVLAPVSHENTRRLCRACIRLQMGALLSRHRAVPSHMCVLTCLVSTFPTDSAPGHPWHQLPASGGCHHRHEWRQDL